MRYNHYFSNFTSGEIAPQTYGISDTEIYAKGAELIDNFIVQKFGGVERRPGTVYSAEAATTGNTRLVPFFHAPSGTFYGLEFSNLKMRVFKDGVLQGAPYELTTEYTADEVKEFDFAASGDLLFITHENHYPKRLSRQSDTSWTIENMPFECTPMYPLDDATYGRTEDMGNSDVTLSLSGSTLTSSDDLFSSDDVGKYIRIKSFVIDPVAEANATVSTTQTTTDVKTLDGAEATVSFEGVKAEVLGSPINEVDTSTGAINEQKFPIYTNWVTLPSQQYISIPDQYVKLPLNTTTTRTTPYSTITTTVTRGYTDASTGTTITSGTNTYTSASANSETLPKTGGNLLNKEGGTVLIYGTDLAEYDQTYDIEIPYAGITTQYSGSVMTSESTSVSGNVEEKWGLVRITAYSSATSVTIEVIRELASTSLHSSQQWQFSRFGTSGSFPKRITFNEGRCLFGNFADGTNVIAGSKSNNIYDFEPGEGKDGTVTTATAFDFKLTELQDIQWLHPAQRLIIGDIQGVYSITGGNLGINPVQPPVFRKIADSRCSPINPIFIESTTFYVHAEGKKVAALEYRQGEYSGFDYRDASIFSEHLLKDGITEWAAQDEVIWCITTNGLLRGFTFNEEFNVRAWHRHTLTNGEANSICVAGGRVYFAMGRNINSTDVQYIEYLADRIQDQEAEDMICVDCSFTYDGTSTTSVTGLSHLEGENIEILANGASAPSVDVSSGTAGLTTAASVIQLGIPYVSELRTVEVMQGNRRGSRESIKTRIKDVGVKLYKTSGGKISSTEGYREETMLFNENQVWGQGPDLFSGTQLRPINSGYTLNPKVIIKSDRALPISVLGISIDLEIMEG